uniref:transcobalamin-2-like n=1 Tax=Styela clava TaxID=7725 RepID=UPI00193A8E82|nr:transcobalamin-2-like [Styela clava]
MKIFREIFFVCMLLGFVVSEEESTYETCGDDNSEDVISVINATVDRLMELRHPNWGWTNTPEVVLGLQLSAQENFFGRCKALEQMEIEINDDINSMNIGKLALYAMAVKSSCKNPRSFAGKNLVKVLNQRVKKQFSYDGKPQTIPYDRYYRFGLAVGALCVNKRKTKNWVVRKLLKGQNTDGSFGDVHSVDDAAQILLALSCVKTEVRPCYLTRKIKRSIAKLVYFLRSKVITESGDVWIGNKYSSPSSVLGLMEEDEEEPSTWRCGDIMGSLTVNPGSLENEGAFSQRLPALAGDSYLNLMDEWQCQDPVSIPPDYQPKCNTSDPSTCSPATPTNEPIPSIPIDVRLTIFTDPPPTVGNVSNADVTVTVNNGSTLYDAMVIARDNGLITFVSQTSTWGESIKSMQGVAADGAAHEYWALIDGATGQLLSKGVSSYVPSDGEQIVFRLKTW